MVVNPNSNALQIQNQLSKSLMAQLNQQYLPDHSKTCLDATSEGDRATTTDQCGNRTSTTNLGARLGVGRGLGILRILGIFGIFGICWSAGGFWDSSSG